MCPASGTKHIVGVACVLCWSCSPWISGREGKGGLKPTGNERVCEMGKLRGGLCSFHLLGAHMLYPTLPALLGQAIKACGLQKAVSGLSACVVMEAQLFPFGSSHHPQDVGDEPRAVLPKLL